jgi:hypothetical protein
LNLGFYCFMGDYFVSWVLDGGFYCILGFMWVLGVVGMQFLMGFSCGLAGLLMCT